MNVPRAVLHIGQGSFIFILLLIGIFELYTSITQKYTLNLWIIRSAITEIILRSTIDLTILAVFWVLISESSDSGRKIKALSFSERGEDTDSSVASTRSFNELINRDLEH